MDPTNKHHADEVVTPEQKLKSDLAELASILETEVGAMLPLVAGRCLGLLNRIQFRVQSVPLPDDDDGEFLDMVMREVEKGTPWAIQYYLSTECKDRGY